jgi:hypothetical protein
VQHNLFICLCVAWPFLVLGSSDVIIGDYCPNHTDVYSVSGAGADVWSLGVTLYMALGEALPFEQGRG